MPAATKKAPAKKATTTTTQTKNTTVILDAETTAAVDTYIEKNWGGAPVSRSAAVRAILKNAA